MSNKENPLNVQQQCRLGKIARNIPRGQITTLPQNTVLRKNVRIIDHFGQTAIFDRLTPIIGEQSIPPFRVHYGGGREYGAGFSKKAIQKARKKQKLNNSKS